MEHLRRQRFLPGENEWEKKLGHNHIGRLVEIVIGASWHKSVEQISLSGLTPVSRKRNPNALHMACLIAL